MWPEEFKHYSNFYTIPILIIFISLPTKSLVKWEKKLEKRVRLLGVGIFRSRFGNTVVNLSNEANQELLASNLRCQDKLEVRCQKTEAAWLRHLKSYESVKELVTARDLEGIYDMLLTHADFLKVETCNLCVSYLKHGNKWLTDIISKSYLYYFEKSCNSVVKWTNI